MQTHHKFIFTWLVNLRRMPSNTGQLIWFNHSCHPLMRQNQSYAADHSIYTHICDNNLMMFHISNLVTRSDSLPIIGSLQPPSTWWKHMQVRTTFFRLVLWRFALDLLATADAFDVQSWNMKKKLQIPNLFPQREENKQTGVERNEPSQVVLQRVLSNRARGQYHCQRNHVWRSLCRVGLSTSSHSSSTSSPNDSDSKAVSAIRAWSSCPLFWDGPRLGRILRYILNHVIFWNQKSSSQRLHPQKLLKRVLAQHWMRKRENMLKKKQATGIMWMNCGARGMW